MNFNIKIIFRDDTIIKDISCYYAMNIDHLEYKSSDTGSCYQIDIKDTYLITISYNMNDTDYIVYQFYN